MQKLQLSIPQPCHENWQQMTPTEQGRFCNACAKEVVDFSMMTDREVLNYFTKVSTEKVCGRALPGQLDRIINYPKEPKKRLFWYWNYIAMFFMFFTKTNTSKAQQVKQGTEQNPVIPRDQLMVGEVAVNDVKVIKGGVFDIDGNPVPYATIMIKGANMGVSADAYGHYAIKAKPTDILIISGVSFKIHEVIVGHNTLINTILEKGHYLTGDLVITDDGYKRDLRHKVLFNVKDDISGLPLNKARIIIAKKNNKDTVITFTDVKGSYKLKGINKNEEYFIKVEAEGYGINEFTITEEDFSQRKKEWEVLLTKKPEPKPGTQTIFRIGGVHVNAQTKDPLYVIDNDIVDKQLVDLIDPADIEDLSVLEGIKAAALFGPDGANGAIIITLRRSKVKSLDTVSVTALKTTIGVVKKVCTTSSVMGGMVSGVQVKSSIADSMQSIISMINGNIKVYPNPVERGSTLNVYLKLKQAGNYIIQVADAAGRIISQEQFNANTKEHKKTVHAWRRWAAGVYYIRIFDNKTQLISKSSFIVQ